MRVLSRPGRIEFLSRDALGWILQQEERESAVQGNLLNQIMGLKACIAERITAHVQVIDAEYPVAVALLLTETFWLGYLFAVMPHELEGRINELIATYGVDEIEGG